jgi:hypothetical protein
MRLKSHLWIYGVTYNVPQMILQIQLPDDGDEHLASWPSSLPPNKETLVPTE